ncbi:MAG: hypothetical protein QM726_12470 [Chitinophagaceae bacterium]
MTFYNFKYWWRLFLFAFFINACGQTSSSSNTNNNIIPERISFDTSNIAIIQFDTSVHWLFDSTSKPSGLTQSDILEIDSLFDKSITDYNAKVNEAAKKYYAIDLTKRKYKRQYVCAINKDGQKEVYINCFCDTFQDNWKKSLVQVDDGGNCFFNFKINLTTKKYFDFFVNGYA